MLGIGCLSLLAFIRLGISRPHSNCSVAAPLWTCCSSSPFSTFTWVSKYQGRTFTVVPRTMYTGSGRWIRVSGRAGDDAIGGGQSFALHDPLVKYIAYAMRRRSRADRIPRDERCNFAASQCNFLCAYPIRSMRGHDSPQIMPFGGFSSWPF